MLAVGACGQQVPDLPGQDVARQRPYEGDERQELGGTSDGIPGILEFEEPGCLVFTRDRDGGRFAILIDPGATVLDGELLLPVYGDPDALYRTVELPAEWNGQSQAYTAGRLEDEAGLVDPETPLAEFCPGWNSWMVPDRPVPPRT